MGEALLELRVQNPADRAFKMVCDSAGFDMKPDDRTAAIWLASNWSVIVTGLPDAMWVAQNWDSVEKHSPPGCTHPHAIRAQVRTRSDTTEPIATPEPDAAITAAATTVLKHQRRLAAVDAHRKGTGLEAVTAQRQFAKTAETAETLGVSQDALSDLIDKMDPFGKLPFAKESLNAAEARIAFLEPMAEGIDPTEAAVLQLNLRVVTTWTTSGKNDHSLKTVVTSPENSRGSKSTQVEDPNRFDAEAASRVNGHRVRP